MMELIIKTNTADTMIGNRSVIIDIMIYGDGLFKYNLIKSFDLYKMLLILFLPIRIVGYYLPC